MTASGFKALVASAVMRMDPTAIKKLPFYLAEPIPAQITIFVSII
jgi:hypothetical protein